MEAAKAVELLRTHRIAPTRQRVEIASILFSKPQHLSADQLIHQLRRIGSPISKATVYNTLGLFADKNLVKEIVIDASRRFYDTKTVSHHHLYHTDTGELEDLNKSLLDISIPSSIANRFRVEGVDVVIRVAETGST